MPSTRNTPINRLPAPQLAITLIVKHVTSPEIAVLARKAGYDALYVDLEFDVIQKSAVSPMAQAFQ